MKPHCPSAILLALPLLSAIACGNPAGPGATDPGLTSANGAAHLVALPGDSVILVGIGFGDSIPGTVTVSGGAGPVAGEILSWSDAAILVRLPGAVTSGAVTVVRNTGDTVGTLPLFVRTPVAFDPATLSWTSTGILPRALGGSGATVLRFVTSTGIRSVVLVAGGQTVGSSASDSTYIGIAGPSGAIDLWAHAPDTVAPVPRSVAAMAGADVTNSPIQLGDEVLEAVAYFIGGRDSAGRPISNVSGIGVGPNGEYGLWTSLTSLPQARAAAAATVAFGTLIVVGGVGADSLASPNVFAATVEPSGSINGWFLGPALPEGRAFGTLILANAMLYYIGGERGVVANNLSDTLPVGTRPEVYAIPLSRRTGFFGDSAWSLVGSLTTPRSRHTAFALDGGILVTAGTFVGGPAAESEFAAIAADGTLSPFTPVVAPAIADLGGGALFRPAFATVWDSAGGAHPLIVGGVTASEPAVGRGWWH